MIIGWVSSKYGKVCIYFGGDWVVVFGFEVGIGVKVIVFVLYD